MQTVVLLQADSMARILWTTLMKMADRPCTTRSSNRFISAARISCARMALRLAPFLKFTTLPESADSLSGDRP